MSSAAPLDPAAILAAQGGVEVRVSAASWTSASVEIASCPDLAARMLELLLPTARAHGEAAPTRAAEPVIQSLERSEPARLGLLAPPAGEYCTVTYSVGPADSDAVGIQGAPDMLGVSVRVQGTYRRDGGPWQPFEITSGAEALASRNDVVLDLSRAGATTTLQIQQDLGSWFRDIDFDAAAEARERQLLDNVVGSVTFGVEPAAP